MPRKSSRFSAIHFDHKDPLRQLKTWIDAERHLFEHADFIRTMKNQAETRRIQHLNALRVKRAKNAGRR